MMVYSKVLFVVYIKTSHLTKHSYNVFEEYKFWPKTTIMKKLSDEKKVFRSENIARKKVNDEIKRSIYFINDELQSSIEKMYGKEEKKKNHIGCMLID